mgnify:CR=1 FL=1
MAVEVTFHGACGLVTGSCFEVRSGSSAILIDCGMFQGTKTVKQLNYEAFPFDPRGISAVLLPFTESGAVDWVGFEAHVARTAGAGLTPAINMDTGYANLLSHDERREFLGMAGSIARGRRFIAGAMIEGRYTP